MWAPVLHNFLCINAQKIVHSQIPYKINSSNINGIIFGTPIAYYMNVSFVFYSEYSLNDNEMTRDERGF